jgi:hypothetical protein
VATEMAVGGATKNHTQNVVPIRVPYTTHEVCSPSEWTETQNRWRQRNVITQNVVPYVYVARDQTERTEGEM